MKKTVTVLLATILFCAVTAAALAQGCAIYDPSCACAEGIIVGPICD